MYKLYIAYHNNNSNNNKKSNKHIRSACVNCKKLSSRRSLMRSTSACFSRETMRKMEGFSRETALKMADVYGKITYEWWFQWEKHRTKWVIFHCHVWLPEGKWIRIWILHKTCVCVDCGDGGLYQISEGRILKFELKKKHDLIRWWVRKMG